MSPEISAGNESEIKSVIHILAMAMLLSLAKEIVPCCSHLINVYNGNRVGTKLTSDLRFILTEDRSEHYCFMAYSSTLSCWPCLRVRNKNL